MFKSLALGGVLITIQALLPSTVYNELDLIGDQHRETVRIVQALYNCILIRDPLTAEHSRHMADYSYKLALRFDKENAPFYYLGSLVHDIGKLGIADDILKGRRKLTPEERVLLRDHVSDGYRIISNLDLPRVIKDIVLYHHERYNGAGYLQGLKGSSIPLAGRIAAISDTYSALTSTRPYARSMSQREAVDTMLQETDHYDPVLLNYFINFVLH